jgi:hypothetical protein
VDEGEILVLLLEDAGEPRWRRIAGIRGGQTLARRCGGTRARDLRGGVARAATGACRWPAEGWGSTRTRGSHQR